MTLQCRICKDHIPIEDCVKDCHAKHGHKAICAPCDRKRCSDWHKANLEHHNKYMKEWRDQDKLNYPNRYLWRIAKRRAKETGRAFSITPADVVVPKRCPVFNTELKFTPGKYSPDCPSIDALIPGRGYVQGNIAVISHRANTIKQNATPEELRQVADWLEKTLQSEAPSLAEVVTIPN